jgi:hypothetical protein
MLPTSQQPATRALQPSQLLQHLEKKERQASKSSSWEAIVVVKTNEVAMLVQASLVPCSVDKDELPDQL